jgi:hypothetical protein
MTSYPELDSGRGYRPLPEMGAAIRDRCFSGGLLWGIRP